jgi:uncharacterized protein (TIRG00374 family)
MAMPAEPTIAAGAGARGLPGSSGGKRAWPSLALGALISGAALVVLARQVNPGETLAALGAAQGGIVGLAVLANTVAIGLTLRRWQVMLAPYATSFWRLTQVYMIAHLLNTILPAKLGTVSRVILGAEAERLNLGFVFSSVVAEKVLDAVVMVALFVALSAWAPLPAWAREPLVVTAMAGLVAFAALVLVRGLRARILALVATVEQRALGARGGRISELISGAVENMVALTRRREAFFILAWTGGIWLTGVLVNQWLLDAMRISIHWTAPWLLLVILQLGTRVPTLPASIGLFHYLVVLGLGLYGVDPARALAYAIVLHVIVFIIPAFAGAAFALPVTARLTELVTQQLGARRGDRA